MLCVINSYKDLQMYSETKCRSEVFLKKKKKKKETHLPKRVNEKEAFPTTPQNRRLDQHHRHPSFAHMKKASCQQIDVIVIIIQLWTIHFREKVGREEGDAVSNISNYVRFYQASKT